MVSRHCLVAVLLVLVKCINLTWTEGVAIDRLTDSELRQTVADNKLVVAVYYPNLCESDICQKVNEQLPGISQSLSIPGIKIAVVDNSDLLVKLGVTTDPRFVFYRNTVPILYEAVTFDSEELLSWLDQNTESYVRTLDASSFEHETQAATGATTGDWLIYFYKPECNELTAVWETVASSLRGRVVVANVDLSVNEDLEKRFNIDKCSAVLFLRHGKMYSYELPVKTVQSFMSFAEGWYQNAPSKPVPKDPTPFDQLIVKIVAWIKVNFADDSASLTTSLVAIATLCLLVAAILCCFCLLSSSKKTHLKRD